MPRYRSDKDGAGEFLSDIVLVRVGDVPELLMEDISRRTRIAIADGIVDPRPALNPARGQYESTRIMAEMKAHYPSGKLIGITECDLFIPVLTFVFGEAELDGRAAIFSTHRLREEFYGLPRNRDVLLARALRELWHEAGHLHGLRHCPDWSCIMSSSHAVERVDAKRDSYCRECFQTLETSGAPVYGARPA